ncbi:MAG: hypothetical protein OXL36_06555 [Bryobacterales bacterium]|nr:hypothetical protein [Bryobacterales bacterium]MDE0296593.1 hypothetical protein [Bryobacterales bacterium]
MEKRASYGRIVKVKRPGRVEAALGQPDLDETETIYVERLNGTLRQHCRRFTRKGYAFSKCWPMLEHALALFFATYNFCWRHKTLKKTPAMAASLADRQWGIEELIEAAC